MLFPDVDLAENTGIKGSLQYRNAGIPMERQILSTMIKCMIT